MVKGGVQTIQLLHCGFMVRAETDEEILDHAKYHASHAHAINEVSPQMARKIIERIKAVTVYLP